MTPVVGHIPATSPSSAPVERAAVVIRADLAPHGWMSRTVRAGDTLSDLAVTHRTTVGALITRNGIQGSGDFIAVGQHVWVPRTTAATQSPTARTGTPTTSGDTRRTAKASAQGQTTTTVHIVRTGETLSAIAVRRGVSQASLMKANGLSSRSILQIGQQLKVLTRVVQKADSSNTFAGRTYSDKVVSAASANRSYLAQQPVPSRIETKAMIVATARRHGVDPQLALAISWQESGWNQRQVSVANAIGAMQVIPSSGVWASALAGRQLNLLNTKDNITAGVIILRSLSRSASSQHEAIAGYYQGLHSVQKNGLYTDTKRYADNILVLKGRM